MSILITLLWFLGFAFIAILWMGFAASIIEMICGVAGHRRIGAGTRQ